MSDTDYSRGAMGSRVAVPLKHFFEPQVKRLAVITPQGSNYRPGGKCAPVELFFRPRAHNLGRQVQFFSPCYAFKYRRSDRGVRCENENEVEPRPS
jgi:hypothetical protein